MQLPLLRTVFWSFHDPGNWLPAHIMVLTQYGVTARSGVCFPHLGDFLGIKSFFPFPCLLSNRPITLSSCHLLPFFLLLYLVFAFLPPTEAFRRGGRDLELKLEWAHSGPFVSLPCVLLKMLARCEVVGESLRGTRSLESPGLLRVVCVSCILQRGRLQRAPGLPGAPGTAVLFGRQLSSFWVACPSTLGMILRPHKCTVLSVCFLKTLYPAQLLSGVRTKRRDTGDEICPESSIQR